MSPYPTSGVAPFPAPASPLKTLLESIYSPQIRRFEESPPKGAARLTKTGPSPISAPNCPQVSSGFAGGRLEVGRNGPFGASHTAGHTQSNRQICSQRRMTREADLSTLETGAQAPSRLPRPSRHRGRPQGPRRAPRPGPQASERLSRAFFPENPSWSV